MQPASIMSTGRSVTIYQVGNGFTIAPNDGTSATSAQPAASVASSVADLVTILTAWGNAAQTASAQSTT